MTSKDQGNLFGEPMSSLDVKNLPLILNPNNDIEVMAPGSVYQPLLLDQIDDKISAGPGSLNREEEKFVRDLIHYLYPSGNPPKSPKSPLLWGEKQIWFKRNIEKDPTSFRLRVDSSDWYYPDFVIWIIDPKTKVQTFGFADPKGLALGAHGGWGEHKIVCTQIVPHDLEAEIGSVIAGDEQWTFRIRGILISTSSFEGLHEQRKFFVRDQNDLDVRPSRAQFEQARILFQERDAKDYIPQVLQALVEDNELDKIFAYAVEAAANLETAAPKTEIEADILLRLQVGSSTSDFAASIVQDYLVTGKAGDLGARARQRRLDFVSRLLADETIPEFNNKWQTYPFQDMPSRFLFENRELWAD